MEALTNVLVVYETREPANIETVRVIRKLESNGMLNCRSIEATKVSCFDLRWADTMVFVRSTSSIEVDLIKIAHSMNKFNVLVLDDDFLSLTTTYGADGEGYQEIHKKCLLEVLKHTDCLLAVNKLLAAKYSQIGIIKKTVLTNTIIEKSELYHTRQTGENRDKIRIALYVNDGTSCMFEKYIKPVVPLLYEKYGDRLSYYFFALHPSLDDIKYPIDVHYVPHLSYSEFKRYLGTEVFDIGLAPLDTEGFSNFKYFNKYIEYTLAGIPAIFSECPLYTQVVKDGENGLICNNTVEGWYSALCKLIDDPLLRLNIVNESQKIIYEEFNANIVLSKLVTDLPEYTQYKAPAVKISYLSIKLRIAYFRYWLYRSRGWFTTVSVYLRKGNFKGLINRFKKRILNK